MQTIADRFRRTALEFQFPLGSLVVSEYDGKTTHGVQLLMTDDNYQYEPVDYIGIESDVDARKAAREVAKLSHFKYIRGLAN